MIKTLLKQLATSFIVLYSVVLSAQTGGGLDTSFNIGTGFNGYVYAVALQTDGKILVGGLFTEYNGTTQNRITRLNEDGTLDTSFNTGTGFDGAIYAIVIQPDGKIIVGGPLFSYNGEMLFGYRIVRLNTDGTLDTTFNLVTEFYGLVLTIVLQPDGKILLGGGISDYDFIDIGITRLNADGTEDTSFNIGTGFYGGSVSKIVLQTDGKILAGGDFTSYNGTTQNRIARLNTDGSLDTTFNIGTGFYGGNVFKIAIQPDGKILAVGNFTAYNGTTQNRIARLNTDGSLDTTFNIGTGFNDTADKIVLQTDGKILAGGDFTSYNDQPQNRIVRLHSTAPIVFTINTYSNPTEGGITLGGGTYDEGASVTVTATANTGYIFVNWTENETEVSTDLSYSFVVEQDRELTANFTATSSVAEWNSENIVFYPNPVKDILYFEKEVQKVTVTDLTGKVLSTQDNSNQIDMSAFQNGVYLITIEQDNGVRETSKIVKG